MNEAIEQELIYHAAILWALCNIFSFIIFAMMLYKYKRTYLALYCIARVFMALWGITVPGVNIEVVKVFNGVFLPSVAGVISATATYLFYRHEKNRVKNEKD